VQNRSRNINRLHIYPVNYKEEFLGALLTRSILGIALWDVGQFLPLRGLFTKLQVVVIKLSSSALRHD
jgi:hypothetical protein